MLELGPIGLAIATITEALWQNWHDDDRTRSFPGGFAVVSNPTSFLCVARKVLGQMWSQSLSSTSNICTGWLGMMVDIACL